MSWSGPTDPVEAAIWRRARRRVARDLHPDVGGDPAAYLARLDEVDRGFAPVDERGRTLRRRLRRSRRHVRHRVRRWRAGLPRRFPASRRYVDL